MIFKLLFLLFFLFFISHLFYFFLYLGVFFILNFIFFLFSPFFYLNILFSSFCIFFNLINKNLLICFNKVSSWDYFHFLRKIMLKKKKINRENCKACQRCVSVCPNNSFIIKDGKSSLKEDYICRDCKVCVAACPNQCINFVKFES